jgi:hypothetical protein
VNFVKLGQNFQKSNVRLFTVRADHLIGERKKNEPNKITIQLPYGNHSNPKIPLLFPRKKVAGIDEVPPNWEYPQRTDHAHSSPESRQV